MSERTLLHPMSLIEITVRSFRIWLRRLPTLLALTLLLCLYYIVSLLIPILLFGLSLTFYSSSSQSGATALRCAPPSQNCRSLPPLEYDYQVRIVIGTFARIRKGCENG